MNAIRKAKDGTVTTVDLDYAVLNVIVRGGKDISGFDARRRLQAGEVFATPDAQFFVAQPAVAPIERRRAS
jgi:hypothetical protein